ncbi:MAG: DUF6152 family protein [Gammaproteobacteria bacterium]|nr:DUF6152 family protein [Gammaproteobacteria bacterium]
MKTKLLLVLTLLVTAQASAHHSNAMFERERTIELVGQVEEFQFTNPHTWIQVNVADENGDLVEWSIEWGSPNQLGRQGIRPSTFPPGKDVVIKTRPMVDGSPGGLFVGARFSDGETIGRW